MMSTANCTRNCWIAGGVLGLLVWIFTSGVGPLRWFEGLFLGLIAAGLMGQFLIWFLCGGARSVGGEDWQPSSTVTQPEPVASAVGFADMAAKRQDDPDDAGSRTAEPPQRAEGRDAVMKQPAGGADSEAAAPRSTESGSVASAGVGPAAQPAAKDEAAKDDLKEIKGVGPKLEDLLSQHGVTRFAQIAEWGDAEIDHFAELIGRMGSRIRSDDWVGQARILAAGGETEFSKRVEKGDVY
ncbi:hypothetical protein [Paracoccus onubensis]|uniref:Uncharacterized protein n=1 Tax=Paracoccus onubensis TaxID=1675788 RepID=A0A418SWF6_9RHOB|nr:hypothetical protein [Paracoccus onubensis]RJE85284.1 hypothetical protein D3P04_09695 [Paracoccus onubensis]